MNTLPDTLILPPRTVTGAGAAARLPVECTELGDRGLLVHGRSIETNGTLRKILTSCPASTTVRTWRHPGGEPTLDQLDSLLTVARRHHPHWVAAVGGGSVIDIAKACAGLLDAPLPVIDYHHGAPIPPATTCFVAAPSTAGTGSEATIVSVLTNTDTGVKKSIRHRSFMARTVVLDPELLTSCPPRVIANAGMDALTQAVESFISRHATRFTEQLSLDAIRLIASSLPAVHAGKQGSPVMDLLAGSYLAGIALSNARLGIVHGLAHPLGARSHQPHGLVCAVCLPHALEFNRDAMGSKYAAMSSAAGRDLMNMTADLTTRLGIASPFKDMAIPDMTSFVEETLASGSTAANPRPVTAADVESIVKKLISGC